MAYQVAHLVVGKLNNVLCFIHLKMLHPLINTGWIIICCAVFGIEAAIGIIVLLFIFAPTFILPKFFSLT